MVKKNDRLKLSRNETVKKFKINTVKKKTRHKRYASDDAKRRKEDAHEEEKWSECG